MATKRKPRKLELDLPCKLSMNDIRGFNKPETIFNKFQKFEAYVTAEERERARKEKTDG